MSEPIDNKPAPKSAADTLAALQAKKEAEPSPEKSSKPKQEYQQYGCSQSFVQMVTPTGKKVMFVRGSFLTQDREIMQFLDGEIEAGNKKIRKMSVIEAEPEDPMAVLRATIKAEILAESHGIDAGSTAPVAGADAIRAATSAQTAS